ncbi:MAG: hypothetical protein SFV55_07110 [Haliscomenobacter sp.]|uniref:hypothetical protein n=1 Tax=Haliscomenobacter sp. TaxID=2717303 RepID=UPI0029B307B1|nr:hypothetical protein [Haliscomenobacter sp.]MDX2068179.1 hypothetical protein [Haliscomenobacter sp.]
MKYLVATVCTLMYLGLVAQDVKWGRPHQKPDKNLHISQVVGKTSAGIFTLLTDMREPAILPPVLQHFNTDLKLEKQVPLRLDFELGRLKLEKAVILKDRLHLLLSLEDELNGKLRVFTQEVNPQSLQVYQAPRQIYEINWEKGIFDAYLGFKVSADHSKLLIYNRFPYANGNWLRKWLLVCDEDLLPLWSIEPKFPWEDHTIQLIDYEVDNRGEVCVLTAHHDKSESSSKLDPQYATLIYRNNGRKVKWHDFNLGAAVPQQIDLQLDNQSHLFCGGLLSNRINEICGAFVISIDVESGKTQTNIHSFSEEEMAALDGAPKRLPDFQLRALNVEKNGNISILAEQFLPPFRGNDQRYYGQVLLIRYSADLSSRKLFNLSKSQVSYDQGYFDSFAYLGNDQQYLLLYNDKSRSPMRKAHFSAKGAEDTPLEYPGTEKIKVCPRNCAALSNEELWIYAETADKKHYQVGLLGF